MAELNNPTDSPESRNTRPESSALVPTSIVSSEIASPTTRRAMRMAEAQAAVVAKTTPTKAVATQGGVRAGGAAGSGATRRKQVKRQTMSFVVMSFAGALVATMALPAYAFNPNTDEATQAAAVQSQQLRSNESQSLTVANTVAAGTVSRDGIQATTEEELAEKKAKEQAEKEAAERRAQVAEQFASYSGPSASDMLASPSFPNFDLGSVYGVASQYQGVPYVFGGATPNGFDCSGFVMYVFAQFGVSMPHSAAAQGAMGTPISIEDAVPGDLVIMDGHDGFYAGNGNILHAPYEGTSVRVQPIWTDNYQIVRIGI